MGDAAHFVPTDVATTVRASDALRQGARRMDPTAIHEVARQFEALFLREVLADMRAGSLGEDVLGSTQGDVYQELFDAQMASALARGGGLGIARMLEKQLLAHAGATTTAAPDASAASNAVDARAAAVPPPATGVVEPTDPDANKRAAREPAALGGTAEAFVARVLPHARWAAARLGIAPAAIVAQAALESAWGQRMPRTVDGRPSYNLFGIKAGGSWKGDSAVVPTVEFADGVAVRGRAAFRAYASLEDGVRDYVEMLAGSPRFRQALAAGADALGFLTGLARAGYATDPSYADKLRAVLASPLLKSLAP